MSDYPNEREEHNQAELSDYQLIRYAMDLKDLNKGNNQLGKVTLKRVWPDDERIDLIGHNGNTGLHYPEVK